MRIAVAGGTGTVGQYVVNAASNDGHDPVILSRSHGVNVRNGEGLEEALEGAEIIIDTTNAPGMDHDQAAPFFTDVSENLQRVGARQGVWHILTLSIVGIENTSFGYYRAKLAQEQATAAGPVRHTVMRATQLHEFPGQMIAMTRQGGDTARLFNTRIQPVAARTIGEVLIELVPTPSSGRAPDLAGPTRDNLINLARTFINHRGVNIAVASDDQTLADLPSDGLLPGEDARIEGPSFDRWLTTDDAAKIEL